MGKRIGTLETRIHIYRNTVSKFLKNSEEKEYVAEQSAGVIDAYRTLIDALARSMYIGSKDVLCPLDKLKVVREKMTSVSELYVIEGGDHSFKIGKKHLRSEGSLQEEAGECAANAISKFISWLMEGR
ncbi:hypothetical protein AgCh_034693 [Apium graveolens]